MSANSTHHATPRARLAFSIGAVYSADVGRALSLQVVFEMAKVTVPTIADLALGRMNRRRIDARTRAWSRVVVDKAKMQLHVSGRDRVPSDGVFVYMSNHQSHMDIPVLYCSMPSPTVRMVAKAELFRIPVWGRALRAAEFIEVDRGHREKAIESLNRAAAQISGGVSVWIAPEGSRSKTGAIGPLKKGGFHLAKNARTPIVPIAISGTLQVLKPGTSTMHYGVPVHVDIGEPIDVADKSIEQLMDLVRTFLETNVRNQPIGGKG